MTLCSAGALGAADRTAAAAFVRLRSGEFHAIDSQLVSSLLWNIGEASQSRRAAAELRIGARGGVGSAMNSEEVWRCSRAFEGLERCAKSHPRDHREICRHIHRECVWCTMLAVGCQDAARALQRCVEVKGRYRVPPRHPLQENIPRECEAYFNAAMDCLAQNSDK